ncbi:superoxide dismutase [Cyclospora cayetanensis]|uniref:Superoxide dismutase [Fe] n=1 Tax=Cyclospora cayetanensis TaxID=88456 RepID=A0A1D3CUD1_9EIME|nr:superoxide dismutase [Cyclospora cayetanensis]
MHKPFTSSLYLSDPSFLILQEALTNTQYKNKIPSPCHHRLGSHGSPVKCIGIPGLPQVESQALFRTALRLSERFSLPALPYKLDALEPHISKRTLEHHYGKHHQAYVNKLNALLHWCSSFVFAETHALALELVSQSSCVLLSRRMGLQAAQVWNHSFYFNCLGPRDEDTSSPLGPTLKRIERDFGSLENFKNEFKEKVLGHFGSGWVWLVYNTSNDKLEFLEGHDAQCPLSIAPRCSPLLCCDVWEHAYYLDTQHDRAKYFENFWSVINWHFVNEQFMNNLLETY